MNKITAYARLLRIPGLGALGIPPVIGAMTVGMMDPYNLIILFFIGAVSATYGFILNDYADIELDRLIPELKGKPLVDGTIQPKSAVFICFFLALLAFFFLFLLWYGQTVDTYKFLAMICIFLAGILGSIYDLYGKRFPGSDALVAISMSFLFLLGALSFGTPTIITWIIFILTFNQALHMNAVEGGIKDADHDFMMGVKNIALGSGVKVDGEKLFIPTSFKVFGMGIRLTSAVLLFVPFVFFRDRLIYYEPWQPVIMGILAFATFIVLFFSVKLISLKKFDRDAIRKYIGIQSFLRYSLVPIMLIPIVGILPSIILIFFPIIWYIIFAPLLGEKLFRPRM
jgi:4-hydroxybenzoate polyprenyltransferase